MVSDKASINRLLKALLVMEVVLGDESTNLLLRARMELKIRKSCWEMSSDTSSS